MRFADPARGRSRVIMRPRFLPSARTTNWLLTIGFAALLGAFYLRYLVVENSTVGLACDAGRDSAVCHARFVASRLFRAQVFGFVALGAALLNLIRQALPLFAIAIVALFVNGTDWMIGGLAGILTGPIAYLVFKNIYKGTTDRCLEGRIMTESGELTEFGADVEGVHT